MCQKWTCKGTDNLVLSVSYNSPNRFNQTSLQNKLVMKGPLYVHGMKAILTGDMWNPIRDSLKQIAVKWHESPGDSSGSGPF